MSNTTSDCATKRAETQDLRSVGRSKENIGRIRGTALKWIFSRLKDDGNGRIINHRLRGLEKIALNCRLSV
ncbi:hypothetical protein ES703_125222 [subsurface metagenome]